MSQIHLYLTYILLVETTKIWVILTNISVVLTNIYWSNRKWIWDNQLKLLVISTNQFLQCIYIYIYYIYIIYILYIYSYNSIVVYHYKCCNLIGYATRYLFVDRYQVVASGDKAEFFAKITMLIPCLNFYKAIVNSSFALVNITGILLVKIKNIHVNHQNIILKNFLFKNINISVQGPLSRYWQRGLPQSINIFK